MSPLQEVPESGPIARYERDVHERIENFNDPRQEWRRLFSELLGTFFLVLVAAGAGIMNAAFPARSADPRRSSHRRSWSWRSSCSWAK